MQIIIGPFLFQEVKANTISNLKNRLRLIGQEGIMVDNFYSNLRILSIEEMSFIYHLFINFSNNHSPQINFVDVEAKKVKTSIKSSLSHLSEELEYVKRNYAVEDRFLKIIENGDVETAKEFHTESIMIQLPERASNDSLRNLKTRLTILNTICNRAAIRGGIDIQLGHQISTNYGITIEHMKSIFDSVALTNEIVVSYARAVKEYSLNEYSKLIKKAILLIRINLTRKYSLTDLANDLYISKEHLARRFKKETNMTVANYSNYSKIIEAKKLLDEKSQSIINISNMLGFSNSSYFSKVFKEYTGVTPRNYNK
jgi:AraC-like DNA-binding protein